MTKKQFVQQIIIRALPEIGKLSATVQYAEQLWESMSFYGYGADKVPKPEENQAYYQALSEKQRVAFDKFWVAFKLKKGRNEAAMRWQQLGELSEEQYSVIIEAAKKEAGQSLQNGQVRKMAQGWLHERRYEDFVPTPTNTKKQYNLTRVRLENELANLQKLYDLSPDEALAAQILVVKAKIKGLNG